MSALRFQNNRISQGVYIGALMVQIYKVAAAGLQLMLAAADFDDQNPDLNVSDFTEATFNGYTAGGETIDVWGGPFLDPDDGRKYTKPAAVIDFIAGATPGPETIYGWYLTDGGVGLLAAGKFDTPIVINTQFQTISLLPRIYTSGPDGPDANQT